MPHTAAAAPAVYDRGWYLGLAQAHVHKLSLSVVHTYELLLHMLVAMAVFFTAIQDKTELRYRVYFSSDQQLIQST